MSAPVTKQGKHGTLYLHEIVYTDGVDSGFGEARTRIWGYSFEHAVERFFDGPDDGWTPLRMARVIDGKIRCDWAWRTV